MFVCVCVRSFDAVDTSSRSSAAMEGHSVFPQVTNNLTTCHQPRLIPQYMYLDDLKFQVRESNNVQVSHESITS